MDGIIWAERGPDVFELVVMTMHIFVLTFLTGPLRPSILRLICCLLKR